MKLAINPSPKAIALIIAGVIMVLLGYFWMPEFQWPMALRGFSPELMKQWIVDLGGWGPLVYIAFLALSVVLSQIPGAPLAIVAGTIWSPFLAGIYTVAGGFLGAIIAYGLGRKLGAPLLAKFIGKDISLEFENHASRLGSMIFLSRLFPVVPFDLLSYGAGVSRISWPTYAIATLAGMIPSTFLLTYSGNSIPWKSWDWTVVAVVASILCVISAGIYLLKQWKPWEKNLAVALQGVFK